MRKILIADDEHKIVMTLEYTFRKNGYEVFIARDGSEVLELLKEEIPDVILLDVMMPRVDGFKLAEDIREHDPEIPLFFLSAKTMKEDIIQGYKLGADDYITKPIKPRALTSRINAILRRQSAPPQEVIQNKLTVADLVIDRDSFLVFRDQQEFVFVKKEFELLYFLATHSGKVCTRDSILKNIWGNSVIVTNRTIDVHIRKLREKLGDRYIKTIKGVGYKFESN